MLEGVITLGLGVIEVRGCAWAFIGLRAWREVSPRTLIGLTFSFCGRCEWIDVFKPLDLQPSEEIGIFGIEPEPVHLVLVEMELGFRVLLLEPLVHFLGACKFRAR